MSIPQSTTPLLLQQQHRVIIYTSCYNVIDGVTLTIRKIEQGLLEAGHEVCILTTESGDPANTDLNGQHPRRRVMFLNKSNTLPISIQGDPKQKEISYYLGISLSTDQKIDLALFRPTLIHITAPDFACLSLIQYARQFKIPLMGTYHSNIPEYLDHYPGASFGKPFLEAFFRHQYYFLQRLYVPTPYIKNYVTEQYNYKMDNLDIWGRGVDLSRFDPSYRSYEWRKSLGISETDVVIVWVGRLFAEKRPDIFADVVRRLHDDGVSFRALVIGSGPCEADMKDLPNTHFLGWMSGKDLSVAYASSDVFLFPSAVETFGNVSLEAAASGLPVIVEAGCSGHVVKHEATGYACTPDDVDDFYDATHKLVTDHSLRQEYSKAARKFSLEFENSRVVNKMIKNYTEVSEEFHGPLGGSHANRDESVGRNVMNTGIYPRPLVIRFVELILTILSYLVACMSWFSKIIRSVCLPCSRKVDKVDDSELPLHEDPEVAKPQKSPRPRCSITGSISSCLSSISGCLTSCFCYPFIVLGDSAIMYYITWFVVELILLCVRIESFIRSGCCFRSRSKTSWTSLAEPARKRKMSDHQLIVTPVEVSRKRKNSDFKISDLTESEDSEDGIV